MLTIGNHTCTLLVCEGSLSDCPNIEVLRYLYGKGKLVQVSIVYLRNIARLTVLIDL
jgi:hypothetical protein